MHIFKYPGVMRSNILWGLYCTTGFPLDREKRRVDLGTTGSAQWGTGLGIFPAGMERGGEFLWSSQENPQVSNLMPLPKLGEWWPLNTFHNLHENWSKILPYPCCWLELFYSFTASGSGHSPTVLSCKNTKLKDYLLFQSSHMTINSRQVEKQKTPRVLLSM